MPENIPPQGVDCFDEIAKKASVQQLFMLPSGCSERSTTPFIPDSMATADWRIVP